MSGNDELLRGGWVACRREGGLEIRVAGVRATGVKI